MTCCRIILFTSSTVNDLFIILFVASVAAVSIYMYLCVRKVPISMCAMLACVSRSKHNKLLPPRQYMITGLPRALQCHMIEN